MNRPFRVFISILSFSMAFALAGCGFANVQTLVPTIKKTNVLVVGDSFWLRDSQVISQLASPTAGISVISLKSDTGNQASIVSLIRSSAASTVIMIDPSASFINMASTLPQKRFVWILGPTSSRLRNVTNLGLNMPQIASVAGYIAGGNAATGTSVNLYSEPIFAANPTTSVYNAVYSGTHAAFSNSAVLVQNSVVSGGTFAPGVWVLFGTLTPSLSTYLHMNSAKVVQVLNQNVFPKSSVLADYSESQFVSAGIKAVFTQISKGGSLPSLLTVPFHFQLSSNPGWQQRQGIQAYEQMISSGTLSPTGFFTGIPSPKTAQVLHLLTPKK